jgi:carboxymethylenebutenolidase
MVRAGTIVRAMGETVEFASNGDKASGYLAVPASGSGPGLLVLQEWWGLHPQIMGVADRMAGEGFVALVPDLYHGELAEHTEMDKAAALMNSMPPDRAARDMGGAIDYLLAHDATTGDKVGVIGFCMGGMLTLLISALQGDKVGAAAPFYGAPLGEMEPDWSKLTAPVEGHFAENDDFFPPGPVKELEAKLKGMGKDVSFEVYEGTGHAFANEHDPLGTHDPGAARDAVQKATAFLKSKLGG